MLDPWNSHHAASPPNTPVPAGRVLVTVWEEGELEREEPHAKSLSSRRQSQERSWATTGGGLQVPSRPTTHDRATSAFYDSCSESQKAGGSLWPLQCPWAGVALERDEREGPA